MLALHFKRSCSVVSDSWSELYFSTRSASSDSLVLIIYLIRLLQHTTKGTLLAIKCSGNKHEDGRNGKLSMPEITTYQRASYIGLTRTAMRVFWKTPRIQNPLLSKRKAQTEFWFIKRWILAVQPFAIETPWIKTDFFRALRNNCEDVILRC